MDASRTKIVDGVREFDFTPGDAPTLKDYLIGHRRKSGEISRALSEDGPVPTVSVGTVTDPFNGRVTVTLAISRGNGAQTWLGSGLSVQSAVKDVIEKILADPALRGFL